MKSWPHFAKKSSYRDGRIKTVRITINGPFTNDVINTEVVARLENDDIAFGFVVRVGDDSLPSHLAMLSLLRVICADSKGDNHRLLGAIIEKVGRIQEAQEEYKTSVSFYEPMLRQEPTNAFWYRDLFASHYNSGRMLDKLGDRKGACKEFLESIKHAQKAAELDRRWADILRDTEVKGKVQSCAGKK